jgi:hypothetical protein
MIVSSVVALEGTEESLPEGPRVVEERGRSIVSNDTGPTWEIRIEDGELGNSNNTSTLKFIGDYVFFT